MRRLNWMPNMLLKRVMTKKERQAYLERQPSRAMTPFAEARTLPLLVWVERRMSSLLTENQAFVYIDVLSERTSCQQIFPRLQFSFHSARDLRPPPSPAPPA